MISSPRAAAEATLHRVLDTSQEASLIHRDAVVQYVNPAFRALLGYDAGDSIGEDGVKALVHPDDRAAILEAGEELPLTRARLLRKDGSIVWTEFTRTGIEYLGGPAMIVRAYDLTPESDLAMRRASAKIDAIAQLAWAIAHDFNNILAVILAVADAMLLELDDQHPYVHDLREIESAARSATALTRRLLAFNRSDQRSTPAEQSG